MKNLKAFIFLALVIAPGACKTADQGSQVPANWPACVKYLPGDRPYNLKKYKTMIQWVSPEVGSGLFAAEDIPEGALIGEYTGNPMLVPASLLSSLPYSVTIANYDENTGLLDYDSVINATVGGKWQTIIDAESRGNETRFCNHSYNPNAKLARADNLGISKDKTWVLTNKAICVGQEITVNYGTSYWQSRGVTPVPR